MKKILIFLFLCLALTACDFGVINPGSNNGNVVTPENNPTPTNPEEEHTHVYNDELKYDKDGHWNECECGHIQKKVSHIIKETIVSPALYTTLS